MLSVCSTNFTMLLYAASRSALNWIGLIQLQYYSNCSVVDLSFHFFSCCNSSDEEIGPLSPLAVSLSAGFSGLIAAAGSHCFDTAKSRSQCIVLPKVHYSLLRDIFFWCLIWQFMLMK